jgi:hypothetical protein
MSFELYEKAVTMLETAILNQEEAQLKVNDALGS